MKSDLFDRWPTVIVVLLTTLFFWKLVFSDQFTFLDTPDLAHQVLPWYQVQALSWHDGVFPMWDPYQWTGQPLLGQMQPGAAFPLNWPLFLAPLQDGHISLRFIHWHFVFMHVLAALFMYAMARELGRSRYASLIAGVAFGCSGYIGSVAWPQMLHGAIWIPLIFLLFHRMASGGGAPRTLAYAALCGGVIGMSLLSGHHQTPTFTLLALTGMFLYFFSRETKQSWSRGARLAGFYGVVAAFAFLVGALQLLPAVEYGSLAYRWVGAPGPVTADDTVPYYTQYASRLYPVTLIGAVIPHAHFQVSTFVGFFCLSMGIYGVALCWKERWLRVYSCLALGALVYAFGPFSLLHGWIYSLVPHADKARTPAHAVFVVQFALFLVAAHGIDHFLASGEEDSNSRRWLSYIQKTLVGLGLLGWVFLFDRAVDGKMSGNPGDQIMLASLAAFVLAGLLQAHRKGLMSPPAVKTAFLLLMVFEMSSTNWFDLLHREDPDRESPLAELRELEGVAEFLKSQPGPFRFQMPTERPGVNIAAWKGIEAVDGYLASVSRDLYDFFGEDWTRGPLMMNTVYTVAKAPTRDNQIPVYDDPSGWKVFRNPDANPRAWVVRDTVNISNPDGTRSNLPQPATCESEDDITFLRRTLHRTLARLRLGCDAYVVFADPYFPGWGAVIDGEPAPIYRAHKALRALAAPAGEHTIEFVYRPRSVYLGGTLTAFGLLGCILLAGIARWRGHFR